MPRRAIIVTHYSRRFWAPQPLAPWGHGRVSSGHWVHHGAGSMCDTQELVAEDWGEKLVGGGGVILVVEGSTAGPCQSVPA
jgi:hypothetical protein